MLGTVLQWQVEAITIDSEGLALLGDISESTSLRHAVQVPPPPPLPARGRPARNPQVLPIWQAFLPATKRGSGPD